MDVYPPLNLWPFPAARIVIELLERAGGVFVPEIQQVIWDVTSSGLPWKLPPGGCHVEACAPFPALLGTDPAVYTTTNLDCGRDVKFKHGERMFIFAVSNRDANITVYTGIEGGERSVWWSGFVRAGETVMWQAEEYVVVPNVIEYIEVVADSGARHRCEYMAVYEYVESPIPPGLLDVVLAIDSSGSMADNDPANLRLSDSKSFVARLSPDMDRVGVVSWDDDIDFVQPLTNDFDLVKRQIDRVDADGGTNLDVGLRAAIDELETRGRREEDIVRAIIFLTDGDGDFTPFGQPGSQVKRARDLNIKICTIGLGSEPVEGKLIDIASNTGCRFFSAPTADALQQIFNILAPQR